MKNDFLKAYNLEDFYRETIRRIPAVFYAKDLDGRFVAVNKVFLELFQWSEEDCLGKTNEELFSAPIAEQFRNNDLEIIKTRESIVSIEQVITGRGETRFFRSYKFPYINSDDEVYGTGGISLDITERRLAEDALEKSRMAAMRSARMAAVGEMAAGVAHEINNPLAIISGYAQRLARVSKMKDFDANSLESSLNAIQKSVDRMKGIVSGLRTISREGSKDPMIPLNPAHVIKETLALCSERLKNHSIELRSSESETQSYVMGRANQLEQVLLNLLNNAHDAVVGTSQAWIYLSVKETADRIKIMVQNSGERISDKIEDKIFDPFFTTKPVGSGTGLGLSISKSIVEEHKGKLYLSKSSKNTCFVIELPKQIQRLKEV